jgi:hypothetical protein
MTAWGRDREPDYVEVDVDFIKVETEKAFLCIIGDQEHWLPKSQVKNPEQFGRGDRDVQMEIPEWLAEEKGLGS